MLQVAALKAAGCNIIRFEKRSGTSTAGRDELRVLLDFVRRGDTLMVTRIDRLARSIANPRISRGWEMRPLAVVVCLCIIAVTAAQAGPGGPPPPPPHIGPAPAPVIGTGIPIVLVAGGVLLATKLLARRQRS